MPEFCTVNACHAQISQICFLMNRQTQATRWSTQVSGLTIHYVISDVIYVHWQTYTCMHFTT